MVMLNSHGGNCCGVTHLYLGNARDPSLMLLPMKAFDTAKLSETAQPVYSYTNENPRMGSTYRAISTYKAPAYSEERPAETAEARVRALIPAYQKNARKGGMIEAILTSYQKAWAPILESLGFVRVAAAVNSNSHKTCTMYVLSYGLPEGTGPADPQ